MQSENTESAYLLEDLDLWKLLRQKNTKLIYYWRKLLENGYIVFINAEFERNNKTYLLTYKEVYVKKDDKELRIVKIQILEFNNKITRNDTANTTIYIPFKELMRIRNSTGTYDFTYVYQGDFHEN